MPWTTRSTEAGLACSPPTPQWSVASTNGRFRTNVWGPVLPSIASQRTLMHVIDRVKADEVSATWRQHVVGILSELAADGVDAVIAGAPRSPWSWKRWSQRSASTHRRWRSEPSRELVNHHIRPPWSLCRRPRDKTHHHQVITADDLLTEPGTASHAGVPIPVSFDLLHPGGVLATTREPCSIRADQQSVPEPRGRLWQ